MIRPLSRAALALSPLALGLRAAALAALVLGCGPAPRSRAAGGVATLAVAPVTWNPAAAPVAKVHGVADGGDVVSVFAADGAAVFRGSALVARDDAAKDLHGGGSLAAPDGQTPWLVGVAADGKVERLRGMTTFEDVTARYGLAGRKVRGAALAGPGKVAFLLEDGLAVGAGGKVTVYATERFTALAAGGEFVAGLAKDAVTLVNTTNGVATRFALPGATAIAIDPRGRLYATTERAVYAATADGALALVYDAGHEGLHGLAASGDRVWFADRDELGVVEGERVLATTGLGVGAKASLAPSPSGDVWVLDGGKLARWTVAGGAAPSGAGSAPATAGGPRPQKVAWSTAIAPVFARSCAKCHQPNGVSGTDLSTEAAWRAKAAVVRERVLVDRTMPPSSQPFSEADRAAIAAWLAGPS